MELKKFVLAFSAMSFLAACDFDGALTLTTNVTLKRTTGVLGGQRDHTLPKGTYDTEIKFTKNGSRRELVMSIPKLPEIGTGKFRFVIPANANIPETDGDLYLRAQDSGQPIDLKGSLATSVLDSEVRQGVRTCTYQDREWRCEFVCRDDHCYQECWWETVQRTGRENYDYYVHTVTKTYKATLLNPSSKATVGRFSGENVNSQEVVVRSYGCHPNPYPY